MEKIEPEALSPSLPLRCLVLQVTLIVGRSTGRYRVGRRVGIVRKEGDSPGTISVRSCPSLVVSLECNELLAHPVEHVLALSFLLFPFHPPSFLVALSPSLSLSLPPTYYLLGNRKKRGIDDEAARGRLAEGEDKSRASQIGKREENRELAGCAASNVQFRSERPRVGRTRSSWPYWV